MSARTTYATVQGKTGPIRLGAMLDAQSQSVLVHRVNGGMLGWYNLARFDGGKLTPKTLAALFAPADARAE